MIDSEGPKPVVRWPVLHVEQGHSVEVLLLSVHWLRLSTHFYKRTQICLGTDACPVCHLLPSRCYYYLPALYTATRRPVLLELSPHASSDLEQMARLQEQGFRPGLVVELSRRSKRAPVKTVVVRQDRTPPAVSPREWLTAVMGIYGFGEMREGESLEGYRARLFPAAVSRCDRLAAELNGMARESRRSV